MASSDCIGGMYHTGVNFSDDGRPCKVLRFEDRRAFWVNGLCHMIYVRSWIHKAFMVGDASGQESDAFAAVELEDGTLVNEPITNVRLLGSKEKFAQYHCGDVDD